MSNHCETIQSNISDNIDAGHPISASELDHVDHCSECNQFYQFLHGTSFQDLAAQPAEENFDIDQIKQAAEIMAKLKLTHSQQRVAKRKVINLTVIGAAAAALAVSLSSAFYSSEVAETVATEPKSNVHQISNFELPTIQFEDKYSAINDAMADKMETVAYGIMKLKTCFIEGNAFLNEHTENDSNAQPESSHIPLEKIQQNLI